jgi:hypothetical protein
VCGKFIKGLAGTTPLTFKQSTIFSPDLRFKELILKNFRGAGQEEVFWGTIPVFFDCLEL